jgi:predicted Zn-dependent protease
MFNARQEMDLGDAIAEQVQRDYLVIDEDDVTTYVRRIGARLLAQAPPTELKIQFFLFDLPVANAITLPGGRIYVSRKLVAMTRSEDELASVLGHELGHALTHQSAAQISKLWRDVLGVTVAGSRDEIFHNYQVL